MPVGDLIIWIANRELTGTFNIKKRGVEARFVIRDGKLWQGAALDPRGYLGQHLINFGYISEDQLQKAFDTQQRRTFRSAASSSWSTPSTRSSSSACCCS